MGLKGYRLWAMGQLDSNVQSPAVCPGGQAPQVRPVAGAGTSSQWTPAAQGSSAHPSTSLHPVLPVPEYPTGHAPQPDRPPPTSVHSVNTSHPPLATSL
jgi:hypothetical protein